MPAMKLSLALAVALCSVASGFVARSGPAPTRVRAHASTSQQSAPAGARQPMTMMPTAYDRAKRSIFETDESLQYIFDQNRAWAEAQDPEMFERLKSSQSPRFLYLGCSDSRVPAEMMMGLQPGDLFVHRNVANLCMNTDYSMLAVLKYSVEVLGVTDIIVCGHYGCGGVKAAMQPVDLGLLAHWLHPIRNVQRTHADELRQIEDEDARHARLVELNVQEACMNLFANPIVQKKQAQDAQPRIHGWVYDIATGYLKDVKIDFGAEIAKYKDIYRMYEYPAELDVPDNAAMTPRKGASPGLEINVGSAAPVQLSVSVNGSPPAFFSPGPLANGDTGAQVNGGRYGEKVPYKLGL